MLPSVTAWMDLVGITLSETRQSEKGQRSHDFAYMQNLENKLINKQNRYKLMIQRTSRPMVSKGLGTMGLGGKGKGIKKYKLAITKQS